MSNVYDDDRETLRFADESDWIEELNDGPAPSPNPHYHCASQDTRPCPTGEHRNPTRVLAPESCGHDDGRYQCALPAGHAGLHDHPDSLTRWANPIPLERHTAATRGSQSERPPTME